MGRTVECAMPNAQGVMPSDQARPLSIEHSPLRVERLDEAALLTRASKGDEAAFGELYARYQRQIYLYAARMCGVAAGDGAGRETFFAWLGKAGASHRETASQ